MNCINCKKEFKAKRITARYCSASCRKLAFQEEHKVSVPVVSVLTKVGCCHGCGKKHKDIDPEGLPELRCICHTCINKGISHKTLGLNKEDCLKEEGEGDK